MKKLLALLFIALFFTGYSPQSPEDVTREFIKATYAGDAKIMIELFNMPPSEFEKDDTKKMIEDQFKMVAGQIKGEAAEFGGFDFIYIKDSKIKDKKARVDFKIKFKNGTVQDDHLFLTRTADGWKVGI